MKVLFTLFLIFLGFNSNAQLVVKKFDRDANKLLSKITSKNSYYWMFLGTITETLEDDSICGFEFNSEGKEIGSMLLSVEALEITEDFAKYTVKSSDGEVFYVTFALNSVMVSILDKYGLTIITGDVSY